MRFISTPIIAIAVFATANIRAQQANDQSSRDRDVPLKNWAAPTYWQPDRAAEKADASVMRDATLNPQVTLPTQPLVFVSMAPCRVIDTRAGAGFPSPFGPPSLAALTIKAYPIQSSTLCSIPATALAYSFNITVTPITTPGVNPPGYLGFLTVYPASATGSNTPPNVSTLNNYLGTVVSNAAIIPAGDTNGSVNFYPHDATDVIVDINGYYVQAGAGTSQWTNNGSSIFYSLGNVGIGSSSPAQKLDVTGIGRFSGGIMFGDGTTQTTAATGGSGGSQWTTSGSNIYFNGGNVGIGTTTPGGKLEVNGNLVVDGIIAFAGANVLNAAVGNGALSSNTTGNSNAAFGSETLTQNTSGTGNTALGSQALLANTNANYNTAVGYNALEFNSTGFQNTAVGMEALQQNTIGSTNVAVGQLAMQLNSAGTGNTAIGVQALSANTSGSGNAALGSGALAGNTSGATNTGVGENALVSVSTGNGNVGIGFLGGSSIISGSNNIDIGNQGAAADTGLIRIGTSGTHTAAFIAGITGVNVSGVPVLVSGSGQLGVASSSRRFKQDIEDMGDSTDDLMRLRPVTYRYKQPFEDGSQPLQYGLIAEEVDKVYPELVAHSSDGKIETVKYQLLDSMLLNELQKQHATITAQKDKIQSLEERLSKLESLLERTGADSASR